MITTPFDGIRANADSRNERNITNFAEQSSAAVQYVPRESLSLRVPTPEDMRALGRQVAVLARGGDVILLSGPLGAGKTTFVQGFGAGLGITGPIVSPTFTIAREMDGHFADGSAAHCVHVDAYRLGGERFAPGQNNVDALLDELESLGLDEELEDPGEHTVVLMEWGEQMIAALAPERLEVHISRGSGSRPADAQQDGDSSRGHDAMALQELSENGERMVTFTPVGRRWSGEQFDAVLSSAGCTLIGDNAADTGEEQL